MNGKKWLLDTNIVIYLAKKELDLLHFVKENDILYISSLIYMECLGYHFNTKKEEQIITQLCGSLEDILVTKKLLKKPYK